MGLVKRLEELQSTSSSELGLVKTKPIKICLKVDAVPYSVHTARLVSMPLLPKVSSWWADIRTTVPNLESHLQPACSDLWKVRRANQKAKKKLQKVLRLVSEHYRSFHHELLLQSNWMMTFTKNIMVRINLWLLSLITPQKFQYRKNNQEQISLSLIPVTLLSFHQRGWKTRSGRTVKTSQRNQDFVWEKKREGGNTQYKMFEKNFVKKNVRGKCVREKNMCFKLQEFHDSMFYMLSNS